MFFRKKKYKKNKKNRFCAVCTSASSEVKKRPTEMRNKEKKTPKTKKHWNAQQCMHMLCYVYKNSTETEIGDATFHHQYFPL
jgi:hypothetical protein